MHDPGFAGTNREMSVNESKWLPEGIGPLRSLRDTLKLLTEYNNVAGMEPTELVL